MINELRETHYHSSHKATGIYPGLAVGEVVIAHDEQLPHGLWRLGRIQETIKGRDEEIRGSVVKWRKDMHSKRFCADLFSCCTP